MMKKLKKSMQFPRLPKSDDVKPEKNAPFNHELYLTDLDKIYLLLAEENLKDSFNVLCYDLQIHSLADLNKLDDGKLKRFRLLPNFAKDRLRQLPEKAKTTDFVRLAKKHGKLPYKVQLESHGVPFISVNDIEVIRKTATGPISGTVLEAIWTKPGGEKIQVALRYDRAQHQRKHFLHEAELAASLNHENILCLHGVILPGLYTDSVALVTDFAKYGNIYEAKTHHIMSMVNVIQMVTQIASALEYLESKDLVHLRLNSASIFVVALGKIKVGGLWGCFRRGQWDESQFGIKSNFTSSDMVSWFAQTAKELFRHVAFFKDNLSGMRGEVIYNDLLPDLLKNLFDQCCVKVAKNRPTLSHVVKTLSTFSLPKLRVTSDFQGQYPHELSCKKDEVILLISKTFSLVEKIKSSLSGEAWLGEKKNGTLGLFDPSNTQELVGDEDVNWEAQSEDAENEAACGSAEKENEQDSSVPPEIQARGIEAERAFQRALKKGKVRVYRGRVMLIGQNRAGKTSLKKSLLGMTFDPGEPSTEGIEVDPSRFELDVDRVMNWQLVKNEKFTSEFADDIARLVVGELRSADEERKPETSEETLEETDSVQSDVTQGASTPQARQVKVATADVSMENISDSSQDLQPAAEEIADFPVDPEFIHIEIDTSEAVPEDVKSLVAKYLQSQGGEQQTSDRETVVTVWDFAGQHLYYASHPVFLSPRAIYVLVYNMSKELNAKMEPCVRQGVHDFIPHSSGDETNLDSILSWLVSVHNLSAELRAKEKGHGEEQPYLRPPVIIVGTHVDTPFEDPKRMETKIKKSLSGKTYEQHVRRPFFRVDNTRAGEDEGIKKVRQEIREVLRLEPYMGEDVPVRWFNFERVVEALVQQKTFYLKVSQLYNVVRKMCFIEDELEMVALLDFYHDLGIIIWHGDTVVLQTQWLIHLFRKLITIRPFDEQNPRHAAAWNELEQTGLLSMRLVDHVFAEFLCDGQSQSDILCMMEMYGLMARFTPESTDKDSVAVKYFVPAQLCSCPEIELDTSFTGICSLYIYFPDGFLPHGLFPQLVSRFIAGCPKLGCKDEPNLFQNLARFILGQADLFLICKQSFVEVVLQTKESDNGNGLAALVREHLESILSSLSRDEDVNWEAQSEDAENEAACGSAEKENEQDSSVPPEIQARGIEAERAFQRALKKGKVRVYRGRVMLIGQNRAGKTSLKKSLLGMTFDPGEPSTEGIEVDPSRFELDVDRVMNWQLVKNEKFTSEFADDIARLVVGELRSADEERKPETSEETLEETDSVQSDVTQGASTPQARQVKVATADVSMENISDSSQDLQPAAEEIADFPVDPEFIHIEIDTSEAVPEDVKSLVAKYLQSQGGEQQTSDRETVVTVWDFAGQHLYYASHPVFLSPRAIYVLVYNMSKELNAKMEPCVRQGVHDFIPHSSGDETNLDSILSWLVSVHNLSAELRAKEKGHGEEQPYLRPPVIIVGTHVDTPFEDPKRMETKIKKSLSGKTYEQHVRRPFFRVDNTRAGEDEGIKKVRQEIREVLRLEPYMGEDVPVRWFNFERVVEALVQQKTFYLKVSQLYNVVRKMCFIEDELEMVALLDFYHDLGIIIWHGDTVVLQTQWLIHLFRKLITIRPFDEQNPRHAAAWNELEQTGLLSMRLVDHVFAEFLCDGQSQSDILCMMEMYGLMARFTPESTDKDSVAVKYFVPAQLCSCPEIELDTSFTGICSLYIYFPDGFLPHGLFPQLVSRFIAGCPKLGCKDEPNLFQNLARFILGQADLFLICKQSFVEVVLQTKESDNGNGLAALVREHLESILSSLSRDFACLRNMCYDFCVACPSCSAKACAKHKTQSCAHSDCIHFLPISNDGKLICTKTFGARSRLDVPGLDGWRGSTKKTDELSGLQDEQKTSEDITDSACPSVLDVRPEVFISYQWDLQDTVKLLKDKLEESGFQCWMDIGQMGGGDSLFAEIDAGIRASKVVICCVTQRYCKSEMCQREVTLADALRKPIIPLLFEFLDWPPAGQLALIFAKLLYIDMSQGPASNFPEDKLKELCHKVKSHIER